jgi:hypothetical protein
MAHRSATISPSQRSHSAQAWRAAGPVRGRRPQRLAQGRDEAEQGGCLVPHLVHQRRGQPGADHALARDADQRDRIVPAAGQAGVRPADRRARPARQIADHRRRLEQAGQGQGVARHLVEPGQPDPGVGLAALAHGLAEDVELREHGVHPQPQEGEPALPLGRRGPPAGRGVQPAQVVQHLLVQRAPTRDQEPLDGGLGRDRDRRRGDHRLVERERLDPLEPAQKGAGLLRQHPGGEGRGGHWATPRRSRSCCHAGPTARRRRCPGPPPAPP